MQVLLPISIPLHITSAGADSRHAHSQGMYMCIASRMLRIFSTAQVSQRQGLHMLRMSCRSLPAEQMTSVGMGEAVPE